MVSPSKNEYLREQAARRYKFLREERERKATEKKAEKERYIQERLDYKKWGVGNFVNYPIPGIINRKQLKVYRVWCSMLSRCYSKKNQSYKRYGGRGVYVCKEWHQFQNFAEWYYKQKQGSDWHIDKDILVEGNLVYGPDTCTFVPPSINTFFATLPKNQGYLPTLTFDKGGYKVAVSDGAYKYNKLTKTQHEGFVFYKKYKEDRAKELAKEFADLVHARVIQRLLNFSVTLPPES